MKKSYIKIIQHIDGKEFKFNCPNCNIEISIGDWDTKTICKYCNKTITIVIPRPYAQISD